MITNIFIFSHPWYKCGNLILNYFSLCQQVGMGSIAHWKVVLATAMLMANARPITTWNGSAGVSRDGLARDVTSILNKTAQIVKTMMKVSVR